MIDLIKHDVKWFRSAQGIAKFNKISTLEERMFFILAFLKSVISESGVLGKISYRITKDYQISRMNEIASGLAIFLADAIYNSDLPCATYPALIDLEENPFLEYWQCRDFGKDLKKEDFFKHFSSIIFEENDNRQNNETVTFEEQMIDQFGSNFSESAHELAFEILPDTAVFDLMPELQLIQLKNMWIFDRGY